jgi:hypothetical protein
MGSHTPSGSYGIPRTSLCTESETDPNFVQRDRQCLDRRIGERSRLVSEIAAWQQQRNASGARIDWKFTTQRARQKLSRAYPDTAKES